MAFVVIECSEIVRRDPTGGSGDTAVPAVRSPSTGLAVVIATDASLALAIADAEARTTDDSPQFGPILGAITQ